MRIALVVCLLLTVSLALAQSDPIDNLTREGTEWANFWCEQTGNTTLPRILIIGDSITNGYSGATRATLKDKALVDMMVSSANVCDPALLLQVQMAMLGYKHTVIHFNNGLHGFHLSDAQYEAGLRRLVATLRSLDPGAKLIWGSSTPIIDMTDKGGVGAPANQKVIARNAVALRVMNELGIPVDDLYTAAAGHGDWRGGDPYHFNDAGRAALAAEVAKAVSALLP
jgi:lysophospholipase L1-like esterase